jgi:cytochrome c oxidase assembly factor CtaG
VGVAPVCTNRHGAFGVGMVAGVLVGAAAVALVALGVVYVVARRRLARGGTEAAAGMASKSNA